MPGTHCVWKLGVFCNIYIGFGYKDVDECFYPTQLTKIDKNPEVVTENQEPNPEKEPVSCWAWLWRRKKERRRTK